MKVFSVQSQSLKTGFCCSVAQLCLNLQSHGLQHTRLPCPSQSPGTCSNSHPSSQWCHPTIILCHPVICFSFPQCFLESGSFPKSRLFGWGGQSVGASASASVLPMNIQDWFPLGLTGLISLLYKALSRVFPIPQFKSINSSVLRLLYGPVLTSRFDYWGIHSFNFMDLCQQSNVSLFNTLFGLS